MNCKFWSSKTPLEIGLYRINDIKEEIFENSNLETVP
jgi:hypothetical protein